MSRADDARDPDVDSASDSGTDAASSTKSSLGKRRRADDVDSHSDESSSIQDVKKLKMVPAHIELSSADGKGLDQLGDLALSLMSSDDQNGLILRQFASSSGGDRALFSWAQHVCSTLAASEESPDKQMFYYEGYQCAPGESFRSQLLRELREDFDLVCPTHSTHVASAEGKEVVENDSDPLDLLATHIERIIGIYEAATGTSETSCWKVKIQLNQPYACTKYHDDAVVLRLVTTLVGDGTVLAHNDTVDWDRYIECEGALPPLDDTEEDVDDVIKRWNATISEREFSTSPGDLTLMKGGLVTQRPCLHRAPYSVGSDHERFLITLDRIEKDEMEEVMEVDLGALIDDDEDDVEDAEDDRGE